MTTAPATTNLPDQRVFLAQVPWRAYITFLRELGDRPIRVTYDRGDMEIMSPTPRHEWCKGLIGQIVEALTEELGIPRKSFGSTTFRRRRLGRGFEPDESYYIANEQKVRGRVDLDLRKDPPPDLAIEIDVTYADIERLQLYVAFQVPEVWRWKDERLEFLHLLENGTYESRSHSRAFPGLAVEDVNRFLARRDETDETSWIRSFRAWVRATFLPGTP